VTTTADIRAISLPPEEAIRYFGGKARVPTDHWTDVWRSGHAHGFMVAGATSDALLSDFQEEISKALRNGTTLADFRHGFNDIVSRHGWAHNGAPGWRAQIIYETNLSMAYSAGEYRQLTDPDALAAFPYWQYVHSGSLHPRREHLSWNGIALRADDPWWRTHYPPNGWKCGCRVRPVSGRGLARQGKTGPDASPAVMTRPWRNPKTGAVSEVPVGIDAGFDYNPGAAWLRAEARVPEQAEWALRVPPAPRAPRIPALPARPAPPSSPVSDTGPVSIGTIDGPARPDVPIPPPSAKEAAQIAAERIRRFLLRPDGHAEVGHLPADVAEAIGAKAREVRLSAETLVKQRRHHPELSEEEYLLLPRVLASPTVVLRDGPRNVVLLRRDGHIFHAVVKTTADGSENYLTSFRRTRLANIRTALRRGSVMRGNPQLLE
jgi:hypothetical protein